MEKQRKRTRELEEYLNAGRSYIKNGQIQKAIIRFQRALELAEKRKDKKQVTEAKLELAQAYKLNYEIQLAIETYDEVLKITEEQGDKDNETKTYIGLGNAYGLNHQFQTARKYFDKALERGDKKQETNAYIGLAQAYRHNNQFQLAINYYDKALEIAKEQDDNRQKIETYLGLGIASRLNNQFDAAIAYYEKALEIAKNRDEKQEINSYLGLGHTYGSSNQCQRAIKWFEKALKIANKRGYKDEETSAYIGLGDTYRLNNLFEMAIENYKKASEIAKEQGIYMYETGAYLGLGHTYRLKNQLETAIKYFEKALEIAKERAIKMYETDAYIRLGRAYRLTNDIETSIMYCKEALNITREQGDKKQETEALLGLGNAYRMNNQIELAIEYFTKVTEIATEQGDQLQESIAKNVIEAYQHLGSLFTETSDYEKAIEYYQKARKISPDLVADEMEVEAYQWLGYNYLQAGQYQESMKYYNEVVKLASQLGNKMRKINAYLGLGSANSHICDFMSSRRYFLKALTVAEQIKDKGLQKEAYTNLGNVYYKSCKFEAAVKSYVKVQEISQDLGERKEEANACLLLGDTFQELKQHEKAIESYQKTLNISDELEDKEMQVVAIQRLGTLYLVCTCCKDCDYENAIEWYAKALNILGSQPNDHLLHVRALTGLGDKDLENKEMQAVGAIRRLGKLHLVLASVCFKDCDYKKAIEWYEHALDIFGTEPKDHLLHVKALTGLGVTWFNLGNTEKAIESIQEAQTLAKKEAGIDNKKSKRIKMTAEQLLILGRSYERQSRNEEAIKSYEKAVEISDETDRNDIKAKAYQHLANVFSGTSEYEKAMEYYQKARKISPDLEGNEMEVRAYQWLGYNHLQAGQHKESIDYYKEVVKLASQLGDKKRTLTLNAYLGLGCAFCYTDDFEFSRKYFLKALTVAEQMNDKALQKEAYTNLGYVYYKSCKFDAAVKSYLKVQEISRDLGERKKEANACLMLGDTFQELKQHEKAIESYQTILNISGELEDKEMQVVAIQRLGTLYLTLASICSKDCDHEKATKWYEKALDILGKEPIDHLLHEKALTGLGAAWFNRGDTKKAMKSIHEAQKFAKNTDTDSHNIETTHEHINSTEQKASYSPVPEGNSTHAQESSPGLKASSSQLQGAIEAKESEKVVMFEEKEPVITGGRERAEALMEEACNFSRTEGLRMEDLVLIEKYIEISASYVYSRQISTKKPFTEKVRKAMTEDVKKLAYTNLLGKNDQKSGRNDGKFVNEDQQVFNFARSEVFKNASTQMPARLNEHLVSYMKSIGQIACGKVRGTCFLVTDALVITNYHVYRMIKDERTVLGTPNLPITVRFDYLYPEQTENIVTVDVDEEQNTTLENPLLDYKFFRLKQNEGLKDRVPLGPIVRNWQLSDGRVIIIGHPEGKEMQEEVNVVVGYDAWLDRLNERYKQFSGVHMTNSQLLWNDTKYQDCLPYDTSFFRGSSGSPVIEMNGNIVAMHTQGYLLDRKEENIPNQQENIPHQEQQDISRQRNTRTYSLMEFGVQFISICRDIRRWHGENVVKLIFPNYELKLSEEPMDAT